MAYLAIVLASLVLLSVFTGLTVFEAQRGTRLFPVLRSRLDHDVERLMFVVAHVDFAAFLRDESKRLLARAGHDLAHGVLVGVRFVERTLTRLVRHLRLRGAHEAAPARETSREFVRSLADFKGKLNETHAEKEQELHRIG